MYTRYFCLICTIILITTGCGNNSAKDNITMEKKNILDIPQSSINLISEKKIYFGHMSVGYNIINGINNLLNHKKPHKINIVETNNPTDLNKSVFAHSKIGKNLDPISKIDSFADLIKGNFGEKIDIAFLKLCYVDLDSVEKVDEIFQYYKKSLNELIKKYSKMKFIHFTVPLTTVRNFGIKGFIKEKIKKIIGRQTTAEKSRKNNIKRYQFNELIRKEYQTSVFDLAKVESTHPNGKREVFNKGAKEYYALVPDYSYDGGHLNNKGSELIARQLLLFLANNIKSSK